MGVTVDGQLTVERSSESLGSNITRRLFFERFGGSAEETKFCNFTRGRYEDLDCYGSLDVPTPHLDSLARGRTRLRMGKSSVLCGAVSASVRA